MTSKTEKQGRIATTPKAISTATTNENFRELTASEMENIQGGGFWSSLVDTVEDGISGAVSIVQNAFRR